MKNKIKWFGIIVIAIIIGLSMTSCGDKYTFKLRVTNSNSEPITKVEFFGNNWSKDINMQTGISQTFEISGQAGYDVVTVYYGSGDDNAENHILTIWGQTTTITLEADGKLTSDRPGLHYQE